jgi:Protein of unknown function (DUF2905)
MAELDLLWEGFRVVFDLEWGPMDPLREFGRVLVVIGLVLAGVGALLSLGAKLPFRLGRLPGDIAYQGKQGAIYFPLVTCLLLSLALTLLFWIVNLFRR